LALKGCILWFYKKTVITLAQISESMRMILKSVKLIAVVAGITVCLCSSAFAQKNTKKGTYVGPSGTTYSHYEGNGEYTDGFGRDGASYYCYECRTFHHNSGHAHEASCNHCEGEHHHAPARDCGNCEGGHHGDQHGHMQHDMACGDCREGGHANHAHVADDHAHIYECADCGHEGEHAHPGHGDYMDDGGLIIKYRPNKMKVKCNVCNAKWKVSYPADRENYYDIYDGDDRIIMGHNH
jgi:hypothetical protein